MQIIYRMHQVLFLIIILTACGSSDPEPDQPAPGAPDIRGTINNLQLAAAAGQQVLGTALIEGPIADGTSFDRALVRITTETRIWEQQGAEYRKVVLDTLAVGQRVEARFTGPVAESYPVQATASEIVILK